jgi:hypothetical protein
MKNNTFHQPKKCNLRSARRGALRFAAGLLIGGAALLVMGRNGWTQPPPGARPGVAGDRPGVDGTPAPRERPPPARRPATLTATHLRITLGKPLGTMKPLLGINAGPAPSGEPGNADLTEQYRWAGVREVRSQDFYGPLDLSVMYPDLRADPDAAASYSFAASDKVFAAITGAGAEPYLRLGDSYNNARIPANRQEAANYAKAAVKVTEHYRRGAMNGFNARFRYVEIGNEPDNRRFWPGRFEDFFPVFVDTFKGLKRSLPDLKVGGPGFVVASYKVPAQRGNVSRFLACLREAGVQPDFISFHLYSDDPAEYFDMVQFYRAEAKKYGMEKAELHISEWNTEEGGLAVRVGPLAAPLVTACWIALQQAGADASLLFRGTDTNRDNPGFYGIFFADGKRKPAAYAFQLWSRMAAYPERIEAQTGDALLDGQPGTQGPLKPVWLLAGRNPRGDVALLIANIGPQRLTYELAPADTRGKIKLVEFADPRQEFVEREPAAGDPLILAPFSMQFVTSAAR